MTLVQQKDFLYKTGWAWTGRYWFKVEKRKPGKTLMIDLPRNEAVEWEQLMQGAGPGEKPPEGAT